MSERDNIGISLNAVSPAFALNAAFLIGIILVCTVFLWPRVERAEQQIAGAQDATFVAKRKLRDLELQAARNLEDRAAFAALEETGLFETQNRLRTARLLEELRMLHRLSGLEYQILPVKRTALVRPGEPGLELIVSDVTLEMTGFIDRDILDFVQALVGGLPGNIVLNSLEMTRVGQLDSAVLRKVSKGVGPELVRGRASLSWRTLQLRGERR